GCQGGRRQGIGFSILPVIQFDKTDTKVATCSRYHTKAVYHGSAFNSWQFSQFSTQLLSNLNGSVQAGSGRQFNVGKDHPSIFRGYKSCWSGNSSPIDTAYRSQ